MTTTNDGGPAFPTPDNSAWDGPARTPGMTLRDWFAGQALAGIMAAEGDAEGAGSFKLRGGVPSFMAGPAAFADAAYMMADSMLAARKPRE